MVPRLPNVLRAAGEWLHEYCRLWLYGDLSAHTVYCEAKIQLRWWEAGKHFSRWPLANCTMTPPNLAK